MGEQTNEEILRAYLRAYSEWDAEALARLRDPAWTVEYPQSGELIRGHANERAMAENYPGGMPVVDPDRILGSDDTWVVTPSFTLERIAGGGDAWWSEGRTVYPDGSAWHAATIYQLHHGKIYREITYWAEEFEPPAWRAQWVEPLKPR